MSLHQIVVLEQNATLSVDKKRLKICVQNKEHFFAFADIAVLYLDSIAIRLSHAVLQACSKANTVVLVSDERHMPAMMCLPHSYNNQQARRSMSQARHLNTEISHKWWQLLVKSRISTQADTLQALQCKNADVLYEYALQVLPGDSTMVEAKAARVYWGALFGKNFIRHKQGATDAINSALNYGFAIVRAAMARVLTSYGLHLSFGFGHCRKDNPFNLVEDMMEPFRFIVERYVFQSAQEQVFNASVRRELLQVLDSSVPMQGKTYRSISAMEMVVQSLCRALEDTKASLILPSLDGESEYEFSHYMRHVG